MKKRSLLIVSFAIIAAIYFCRRPGVSGLLEKNEADKNNAALASVEAVEIAAQQDPVIKENRNHLGQSRSPSSIEPTVSSPEQTEEKNQETARMLAQYESLKNEEDPGRSKILAFINDSMDKLDDPKYEKVVFDILSEQFKPGEQLYYIYFAEFYRSTGDSQKAESLYVEFIEKFKQYPNLITWTEIGEFFEEKGDPVSANYYKNMADAYPTYGSNVDPNPINKPSSSGEFIKSGLICF